MNLHVDLERLQPEVDLAALPVRFAREFSELRKLLDEQRQSREITYLNVDRDTPRIAAVEKLAQSLRGEFENFLLIGNGGSSWGPIAIHTALNREYHNETDARPRFYFLDNSDPVAAAELLEFLDWRRTLVNVISKSGTTPETLANFALVLDKLRNANPGEYARQVVVTTDPGSLLETMAREQGFHLLEIPPQLGGRYSLFSAVGLFPSAILGLDWRNLLRGAAGVVETALGEELSRNPVFLGTFAAWEYLRERRVMVLMPYHRPLRHVGNWYAQLWAESLGKKHDRRGRVVHSGTTPLGALGAADQHSLNQLFMEGPADKLITFVRVERFAADPRLPRWLQNHDRLSYLAGHTLGELINVEQTATAEALRREGRGSRTLVMPRLSALELGELFQFFALETHLFGELLGIDPFDQPGVELGKVITRQYLENR